MGSSFYTNGRGDLCPRERRGGTMWYENLMKLSKILHQPYKVARLVKCGAAAEIRAYARAMSEQIRTLSDND
jgi:hypothetical protein